MKEKIFVYNLSSEVSVEALIVQKEPINLCEDIQARQDISIQGWIKATNRDIYVDIPKPDLAKIHQGGLLQGGCVAIYPESGPC